MAFATGAGQLLVQSGKVSEYNLLLAYASIAIIGQPSNGFIVSRV